MYRYSYSIKQLHLSLTVDYDKDLYRFSLLIRMRRLQTWMRKVMENNILYQFARICEEDKQIIYVFRIVLNVLFRFNIFS